jgi:hypothetical protein
MGGCTRRSPSPFGAQRSAFGGNCGYSIENSPIATTSFPIELPAVVARETSPQTTRNSNRQLATPKGLLAFDQVAGDDGR